MKPLLGLGITDEQIRELRAMLLVESGNQMTADADACGDALRDYGSYPEHLRVIGQAVRDVSRDICAKILSARAAKAGTP